MRQSLFNLIELSAELDSRPETERDRRRLVAWTQDIIRAYDRQGKLAVHPYAFILDRQALIAPQLVPYLRGQRVVVTGAAGCIGQRLCEELQTRSPSQIVALDRDERSLERLHRRLPKITIMGIDLNAEDMVQRLWSDMRPNVVFHLAAQREPGRAERTARETILSNVAGTRNVCQASVNSGANYFIHASTGKCRLIYEPRLYPATKQLAEFEVKRHAAVHPEMSWACVRFHHVVDNSIVEQTFRRQITAGQTLTVHLPPERRQHGQNALEAVALLLNAGLLGREAEIFASRRQTDYFSVLRLALYLIKQSRRAVPVRFVMPKREAGYHLAEFPGARRSRTLDPQCHTHSFNTVETDLATLRQDALWSWYGPPSRLSTTAS